LASAGDHLFGYGDPAGLAELRVELASYLNRARHTAATADSIVVTAGTARSLTHLAGVLRASGVEAMAVEEPGFPFHHPILRRAGLQLVPVPVDGEGVDVDALAATGLTAVVVTPAHQYPLGTVMSPQRRSELVAWARSRQGWVFEDDYDSEFRYDRQPLGALHGIAPDRVVYLGTASKTLGAGLRVGWMVVPPQLRGLMSDQLGRDNEVSHLTQAVLARFIADGHLDRHVRRARAAYRSRRDQLLGAVQSAIDSADIRGVAAGLHLTLVLPDRLDEHTIVRYASKAHGLALWGLRLHYVTDRAVDGLVLGYCRTPVDFGDSVARLSTILRHAPTG
jgi:GntR family transcriptional regulator/MocR family aminotransferase